jgi:hypothetical protein
MQSAGLTIRNVTKNILFLAVSSPVSVELNGSMMSGDEPTMMWKQSWPTSKYYPAIRLEGLRNTTKHLGHGSQWSAYQVYRSETLPLEQTYSAK